MASELFPVTPAPAFVKITSTHQTNASIGQNLTPYVTDRGGHRWSFELDYAPLSRAQWTPLWAFLVSLRGRFGTFNFRLPNHAARGAVSDNETITTHETTLAGSREITCEGFVPNQQNALRAGDFIRFGITNKVFMVTEDIDANSDGECDIFIEPALTVDVPTGTAVDFEPIFQVSRTEDKLSVDFNNAQHYGVSLEFVESF